MSGLFRTNALDSPSFPCVQFETLSALGLERGGLRECHFRRRFEEFAAEDDPETPLRYEPWGAEYLERWLDGTLTPDVVTKHDLQPVLERDPGLTRKQVEAILPKIYAIYDRSKATRR